MKGITRAWIVFSLTVLCFSVAFTLVARRAEAQSPLTTPPPPQDTDAAISEAVQKAVQTNQQSVLGFLINDIEVNNIVYSNDGRTALVWLAQRDQATGDIIGREPALAVAYNAQGLLANAADWQINFEFGPNAQIDINALPPELVTDELRQRFAAGQEGQKLAALTYTGYKLPWSTALNIKITGSIGHFVDYNSCEETSCRYAYDFWNPDAGNRMFPILASKGGVVQAFRESCVNGDTNCANYLTLRDDSTTPPTYQLYYHIANNSVPNNYSVGTYVQQGQYIGNVDDTGFSSDHHLHFHVFAGPTSYYAWGNSVRIIFSDVPFNGGEPRTCAETVNHSSYGTQCSVGPDGIKLTADDNYLHSGNTGAYPPSGGLDAPAAWTTLTERTLTVSGPASDNLGIARVQVLVNYDGSWRSVADANQHNGAYTAAVDMCSAGIPDGPFALAVRIWDIEGNWVSQFTGMRQLFKNAPCSNVGPVVPACTPAADEVSLYSEPFFGGTCKKFTPGKYSLAALPPVGDNNTQSLQVGADVRAVLFERSDDLNLIMPQGRLETFIAADANLADNRIGARQTSALWVLNAADISNPSLIEPFLTFPGNRVDADSNSAAAPNPPNPQSTDSLVLAWTGGRGATFFTGKLEKGGVTVKTMSEQKSQTWPVGPLAAGDYIWTITACNGAVSCSGATTNSTSLAFTVAAAALPAATAVNAPTDFSFESGGSEWAASGMWRWGEANRLQPDLTTAATKAWIFNNNTSIADATYRAGDLTSPPITIGASGNYFLRFKFFSGVEGSLYAGQTFAGSFWDQRRVQISVNNAAFTDISGGLLVDDTQNTAAYWPEAGLSLGNFTAGQTLRIRYHFDVVDGTNNDVYGWAIDDVRVSNVPYDPGCKDNNDTPATATPIALGGSATNSICPVGDVDVFSFSATGGLPVRIDINAKALDTNNPLDSFITLLDSSGRDVLAANDDENPNNSEPRFRDSLIETVLPTTGTYYVRVKAWDHPGAGGPLYTYQLIVAQNTSNIPRPTISRLKPVDPQHLPVIPFIVEASAADPNGTGVKRVDFYWHPNDWTNGIWTKFASDSNGSDGWWGVYTPSGDTSGSAFYFMATNNAGGTSGVLMTGLAPDLSTPVSILNPLPAVTNSTAIQLSWSASDTQNDIERFDLQYTFNAGAWTDWTTQLGAADRSAWFIGQPGAYQFRLRAVDAAGNQEAYPSSAEAATTIPASTACANDTTDPGNNTFSGAAPLTIGAVRELTQCQNDTDWVSFQAQAGVKYLLFFNSVSGGAAVQAQLYNPSGSLLLAQGQAPGPGRGLALRWTAPTNGIYLIKILPLNPAVYGTNARYSVLVAPGHWLNMPYIGR